MDSQDSLLEETVRSLGRIQLIGKQKDDKIQQLRSELTIKENVLSQTSDDLETEKSARRGLQQELKKFHEVAATNPAHVQYSSSYVAVLLDISFKAFHFQPKYVKDQEKGGGAAVRELLHKVKEYLTKIGIDENLIIQVRAYACPTIQPAGYNAQIGNAELQLFFGHFNKTLALAEIINVGGGAGVDEKLCKRLKLYVADPKCGHIVLGVTHASQYRKALQDIGVNPDSFDRLTLLQGSHGGSTAATPGSPRTLVLDTVFATGPVDAPSPAVKPGSPNLQFDRTASNANIAQQQANPGSTIDKPVQIAGFQPRVYRISHRTLAGKLCDRPTNVWPNDPIIAYLRGAKLCRKLYLLGVCNGHAVDREDLDHGHPRLNNHQSDCLLFLAREYRCNTVVEGGECRDRQCVYRHDLDVREGESPDAAGRERGLKRTMDDRDRVERSDPRRACFRGFRGGR